MSDTTSSIAGASNHGLKGFNPSNYMDHLQSVSGGRKDDKVAKELAQDAIKYLSSIRLMNTTWQECFMNIQQLHSYIDCLEKKSGLTVGTIAEKIRRLKLCVEYTMLLHDEDTITQRCTRVLQQLSKWRSSLRRDIKQRKGEIRIKSKAEVGSATSPEGFLQSLKVREDVEQALQGSIGSKEYKLILAYISAHLIYHNAQRPGVVEYMQREEYENKEENTEGRYIIAVLHHKTSSSSGPAEIVITKEIDHLIERYLDDIRTHIIAQRESLRDRVFLTYSGNEFLKISETMRQVATCMAMHCPQQPSIAK